MKKYFSLLTSPYLPLRERVLRLALLNVTILCGSYAILYIAIGGNLGAMLNAGISCLIFGFLFQSAQSANNHSWILPAFLFGTLVSLSFNWIFSNGLTGGTGYLYLLIIGFHVILKPRRQYSTFIWGAVLNLVGLFLLETYFPEFIHYPLSEKQIFFHNLLTILACLTVTTFSISLLKLEYEQTQQKFQQKKQRLLAANQSRSSFLSTISHEIRTPLNGVIGMASLLENSIPSTEQKEYTQTIKISSQRLLKIINKILDYSNIESGKVELQSERFSLSQCVEEAININLPKALEKKLKLSFNLQPNMPDLLLGDEGKLQQILINLIGNAIKFTQEGNVHLNVEKRTKNNQYIEFQFSIKDTGIGIPQQDIAKLFSPFIQINSPKKGNFKGTGLGLAISKRLVELMNGQIWVESKEQEGTTFHFTAHFEVLYQKNKNLATPQNIIINADIAGQNPLRILLVEDDKINRLLAMRLLEKMGYHPLAVTNGQEAIDDLMNNEYDLIFMDVQMPVLDGLQTTKIIRKEFDRQPIIIAMTANAMPEDKTLCEQAGMDDFLAKPINITALENMLTKWKSSI